MNFNIRILTVLVLIATLAMTSCESSEQHQVRVAQAAQEQTIENERLEQIRIEKEEQKKREQKIQAERDRKAKKSEERKRKREEEKREEERQKKIEYVKWINNSLSTGATPYSYCYGSDNSCGDYSCSKISVKTPYNSDIIALIKKNGDVYRHAYIEKNRTYIFSMPNGTYQCFFYYGKGWNPSKKKNPSPCGHLKGAFIENEDITKDDPQDLKNTKLSYELILQERGNLQTKASNEEEAF